MNKEAYTLDFTKYQTSVEEYSNKHLANQRKAKPTTWKRNRSQDVVKQQHA